MLKTILRKKKENVDRQGPRTNDKIKSIQTKSHKETYTYTLTKGKRKIYIYLYIKKKGREQPNQ